MTLTLAQRTKRINKTDYTVVNHAWGAVDAKGREIGLLVETFEVDFVEQDDPSMSYYQIAVGHYFAAEMQMSKNGNPWGACQRTQYFATAEERAAAIAKRMTAAKKKNAAPVQAETTLEQAKAVIVEMRADANAIACKRESGGFAVVKHIFGGTEYKCVKDHGRVNWYVNARRTSEANTICALDSSLTIEHEQLDAILAKPAAPAHPELTETTDALSAYIKGGIPDAPVKAEPASVEPAPAPSVDMDKIRADMMDAANEWATLATLYEGRSIAVDSLGRVVWRLKGDLWLVAQSTSLGQPIGLDMPAGLVANMAEPDGEWFKANRNAIELRGVLMVVDAAEHFNAEAAEIRRLFA